MKLQYLHLSSCVAILLLLLNVSTSISDATLAERLFPRQAEEREQESTTNKPAASEHPTTQATNNGQPSQTPKLYPELPMHPPPPMVPGAPVPNPFSGMHHPHHHGPTPFVPFGIQAPTGRLNLNDQNVPRLPPQPRPMTPADRLQSQNFANGLGRRLLTMVGINVDNNNNQTGDASNDKSTDDMKQTRSPVEALQNSTVLQQLNNGVHSIYGSLSKMYNSTIQQQLGSLQEQLKKAANSTNPWVQDMSREAPKFYKSLVARVEGAQENLNRLWQEATNPNATTLRSADQQPGKSSFFDHFIGPHQAPPPGGPPTFFDQLGNTFNGMIGPQQQAQQQPKQGEDLGQRLVQFWNTQVQPQVVMVRNQVGSVWRDLFNSGAYTPDVAVRSRVVQSTNAMPSNKSAGLMDDILKDVELVSPEYKIEGDESKPEGTDAQPEASSEDKRKQEAQPTSGLSPQMQNGLINAQRELNQLWMGLSNTLQSAVERTKNMLDPQPSFGGMHNKKVMPEADPADNEIDSKIKDLSVVQRDADMVYNVVQQQQREAERKSLGDQFKNFFRDVNFSGVEQLPNRIGESVTKFGTVMSNFWNQVPERWDNFVHNMRPQSADQASRSSTSTTTTTTTPKSTER